MNLGVLGGSFDPVHHGHLIVASQVHRRLGLDRVVLMVAAQPPHKQDRPLADAGHRLAMARLAVDGDRRFDVSDLETRRTGPSYTIDTVRQLKEDMGPDDRLVFIIGSDSLAELHAWHMVDELVREVDIVTVARSDDPLAGTGKLENIIGPEAMQRLRDNVLPIDPIGISSTAIREMVRRGYSTRYYTPLPVAEYIRKHGLYAG